MEYEKGYVYKLRDEGGPTIVSEPYFKEAVDEMMRARTLCAKANMTLPEDPSYVSYLDELFGRKLDDVRIRDSRFSAGDPELTNTPGIVFSNIFTEPAEKPPIK